MQFIELSFDLPVVPSSQPMTNLFTPILKG